MARRSERGSIPPLPTISGGGLQPGVDLDDSAALLDLMEGTSTLILLDVSVIVYAMHDGTPDHDRYAPGSRLLASGRPRRASRTSLSVVSFGS